MSSEKKCAFYWCIDIEKFFSLTYRVAKLFERPSYTGDWYLLRAKFINDWNFSFVRMGEREVCWQLQKCCEGVGGDDGDIKSNCTFLNEMQSNESEAAARGFHFTYLLRFVSHRVVAVQCRFVASNTPLETPTVCVSSLNRHVLELISNKLYAYIVLLPSAAFFAVFLHVILCLLTVFS